MNENIFDGIVVKQKAVEFGCLRIVIEQHEFQVNSLIEHYAYASVLREELPKIYDKMDVGYLKFRLLPQLKEIIALMEEWDK
jgi:hypothetical protein